jgi:hypothetical protein
MDALENDRIRAHENVILNHNRFGAAIFFISDRIASIRCCHRMEVVVEYPNVAAQVYMVADLDPGA